MSLPSRRPAGFRRLALAVPATCAAAVSLAPSTLFAQTKDENFARQYQEDRIVSLLTRVKPAPETGTFSACFTWNNMSILVATEEDGTVSETKLRGVLSLLPDPQPELAYRVSDRWTRVANDTNVTLREPVTITYSFVPDGTNIPGFNGEPSSPSELFAVMNASFPGGETAWKAQVASAFSLWDVPSAITYVEVADDGAAFNTATGVLGSRGDVRISMHLIDGNSNVLAYNFFPSGGGDMVLDSGDVSLFTNTGGTFRRFRNVLAHEHGHGLGFEHVDPLNSTKLMEAFLATSFLGPQQDDLRAIMFNYGDRLEDNGTAATASSLGELPAPGGGNTATPLAVNNLAIESNGVVDFYSFGLPGNARLNVTITPVGTSYSEGPQGGSTTTINALAIHDLAFEVIGSNGTTVLTSVNATAAGLAETLANFEIPAAGTYYLRVFENSTSTQSQRYDMTLSYTFGAGGSPTPTASPSPSQTASPSPSPSLTASPTVSPTASASPSLTASPSVSPTESATPSPSASPSDSPTPEPTASQSPSPSPSDTPAPTASASPSPSPSNTPAPTATATASPTEVPTASPSPSGTATPEPTNTPEPTATPDPTESETPSPSPTPEPTPYVFEYTETAQAWEYFGFLDMAGTVGTHTPGAPPSGTLSITSVNNTNSFAFWQSPAIDTNTVGGAARFNPTTYRARFAVTSDQASGADVPSIRFRAVTTDASRADVLAVESTGDGAYSPTAGGLRTYDMLFDEQQTRVPIQLAFDLLNFDGTGAPTATIALASVELSALSSTIFQNTREDARWVFGTSAPAGWEYRSVPSTQFDVPVGAVNETSGGLSITSVAFSDGVDAQFGWWNGPESAANGGVTIEADRIYYANFLVASDSPSADTVPSFRLRLNETGFQAATLQQASSNFAGGGGAVYVPSNGDSRYYTVYFPANAANGRVLFPSFDLLSTRPDQDAAGVTNTLQEVSIYSFPIPD